MNAMISLNSLLVFLLSAGNEPATSSGSVREKGRAVDAPFAVSPSCAQTTQSSDDTGNYKLVKSEESISLYERWVEHNGKEVREMKAEFSIPGGTAEGLEQLLRDETKGEAWNPNATDYSVLPGRNNSSWATYIRYSTPWPMKDHDCLLSYRSENSGMRTVISFESDTDTRYPLSGKLTRIEGVKGKWLLCRQDGKLEVTYFVTTDASRKIPRWVSDPVVHENLLQTMSGVKKLLE